jgi:hypothetical protein
VYRKLKQVQMQSTYLLEKVLKMISLYVNALLCTLQHIVVHAMQLSGVNSENYSAPVESGLSPLSTGALHGRSQRVTIPDAVEIQF